MRRAHRNASQSSDQDVADQKRTDCFQTPQTDNRQKSGPWKQEQSSQDRESGIGLRYRYFKRHPERCLLKLNSLNWIDWNVHTHKHSVHANGNINVTSCYSLMYIRNSSITV